MHGAEQVTPAQQQSPTHDIVIVGGGLVGASLGCALAPLIERYGWRVAIIEANALPQSAEETTWQPSFDARASAIAEGSAQRFRQLGVWEAMQVEATPINRIHIGHVIPNAWMGRVLHQKLQQLPIEWHCPATVAQMTPTASGHHLRLSDGSELTAALTILADGGRSGLKEQLGIASRRHSYEQTAVIAHVGISQPHQGIAYERFTSEGPIALLPLPGQAMELVWTHASGSEQARLSLPDHAFLSQLQQAFGDRVGRFTRIGQRFSYPLSLVFAGHRRRACAPRLSRAGQCGPCVAPGGWPGLQFSAAFGDGFG